MGFDDTAVDLRGGVIQRYVVKAITSGGLMSGNSPVAYTVPDPIASFRAFKAGNIVTLKWAAPAQPVAGIKVYFVDEHLNTLGQPNDVINGWVASWQSITADPIVGTAYEFTIPLASRSKPHTYFFARAVNSMGQEGFLTDIVSPTDGRFVAATADDPRLPRLNP